MNLDWKGGKFKTESGVTLPELRMRYWINAPLLPGQKVILLSHALTANARADEWWSEIAGSGGYFNKAHYHLICINHLGSCYGSTGPISYSNSEAKSSYHDFPELSIKDLARAQWQCLQGIGIDRVDLIIGPSLGGQVAQELSLLLGTKLKALCLIACNCAHSAWGIAFNESQRQSIKLDPSWQKRIPTAGSQGLALARSIALLSYRSYKAYEDSQGRAKSKEGEFRASTYQVYQGEKLKRRFNAFSYWVLSKAMDQHDARDRLASLEQPCLIISLRGDLLFPREEQIELARTIPKSRIVTIESKYGHMDF